MHLGRPDRASQIRQLTMNAEEVQSLRDDVDMWRAKVWLGAAHWPSLMGRMQASEGDRLRADVTRYRERLEDFDYLKKQVDVC